MEVDKAKQAGESLSADAVRPADAHSRYVRTS